MSIWQEADAVQRIYKYLIPAAVVAALVFSLGFFLGRRTVPYEVSIDVERPAAQVLQTPAAAEEAPASAPEAETREEKIPVNINTATKEELMTLPGVGEVLADRIIEYRETYGRFVAAEQLMDVSGIGEQRYADLADLVSVGE